MFPKSEFEKKLNIKIATSSLMDNAIDLWSKMYEEKPPWLGGPMDIKSLNLPSAISEELARLVLTEFSFELEGSERANVIQESLNPFLEDLHSTVEMWCAYGGIAIKPFAAGEGDLPDHIELDIVQANRFYPTAFNSNREVTGAVFVDSKRIGDYLYTRLEYHNLEGTHYTVINKAFRSERLNTTYTEDDVILNVSYPLSEEISLEAVDEWRGLTPKVEMDGIEHPFFIYVKNPRANNIDPHSPLGTSVYARAVHLIEEADKQYSRILWEYEATEAAVDADISLFDTDKAGRPILPKGRERLYRSYDFEGSDKTGFFDIFSPTIRDSSLFNGLNELMRKIEFQCGLAYGTLSDLSDVEKTAQEVKASKQRSYTSVNKMQSAWDKALDKLIAIMDNLCTLYNIAPAGAIDKICTWGDGILEDTDTEYQRRWSMVISGKMKVEKFYAWYFGCTEEEAKEYIPETLPYPPIE